MMQSNKVSRFQSEKNVRPPVQSMDIINPTNEILTVNQEGNTLIWYDASLNSTHQDISKTKQVLRSVNDYVLLFDNEEKCIDYIKSIDTDNIFMVISGRSATTLLAQIHNIKQVKIICIFCINREDYKSLLSDFGKVIGICTEQEELIICLKKAVYSFQQHISLIGLMKSNAKQESHLNAMDAYDFKKQQKMKDIILRMPRTQQSKQKLIDYCQFYYQGNEKMLEEIDIFNEYYESPCQAIPLYTRDSLWFRMINHAFRIQDLKLLERFQFFINDLSQSLNEGFEQLKTSLTLTERKTITLYRGQKFSKEEYSRFPSYGYVTFNSYLSTSSNIKVANMFGGCENEKILLDEGLVPVLFQIELDLTLLNNETVALANITDNSQFSEECEYLFDFGATFEIISINNRTIKMILSDKPHHVSSARLKSGYLYKYASQDIIHEIGDEDASSMENFSSSLLLIDQTLFKLNAFEKHILETSIDDENYQNASKYCIDAHILPRIDPNSLYAVACRKMNPDNPYPDERTDVYKQAIKHFQIFSDNSTNELIEWTLLGLGYAHYQIDRYQEAQKYFIEALEITNQSLNKIVCYYYLGCICGELSNYEESMDNFNKILQMENNIGLSFIATVYFQMAMFQNKDKEICYSLQKTKKKEYLSLALERYEKTNEELFVLKCHGELLMLENYPSKDECVSILNRYYKYCQDQQIDLKLIIDVYQRIGYSYYEDFEYEQALQCFIKTVLYFPDEIRYQRIIADIYIKKKNFILAIEYLNKTLKLTTDPKIIVDCYEFMGSEYFKQNDFNIALKYFAQSVQICNDSNDNIQFHDDTFGFELKRKNQIATCRSKIASNSSTINELYFCTEGLMFSLDFIKLFKQEILSFFQSVDRIRTSNYTEQIQHMMEQNITNNNENHLEDFIHETIFDNYIHMGNLCDGDDDKALYYYTKALKIYGSSTKLKAIRNIESTCTSKINSIFQSNFPYDKLIKDIPSIFQISKLKKRIEEENDLFERNYFNELKQNQLAKLYSHIGNIYTKMKEYEEAKLYYDKSIRYYETFPLLFHLVIADLYSRQGFIIDAQQPNDTGFVTSCTEAEELFDKAIATIYNNDNSLS
ncbi:unnamed protein product [Adineta steineri]|uniref:NAD(P)(+)--arginine ADP-ribosyltransferase n=2 Tax=Adineta steineri TaxID=433720 RepID=A0A815JXK1_9BILA|nr:unnamed protein product [Adineta steineri]